jgi:hypothetical protein
MAVWRYQPNILNVRALSSDRSTAAQEQRNDSVRPTEWRKTRLDQIERKFTEVKSRVTDSVRTFIESDDELQSEWKSMESRVTKRRSLTKDESGGETGRSNVRQTEEEVWLESGLYNTDDGNATNQETK